MTLRRDTVRSAIWTVSSGLGSRVIGLVGTLVITRFIAPAEYGEVAVAAVLAMSANQLSTLGFGQYLVAVRDAGRSAAFHVTVFHVALGALALLALVAFGPHLAGLLDAPGMPRYLGGFALAAFLDRIAFVPERILVRDMRFGFLGISRTAGDLAFTGVSVWLAAVGWGAMAIVIGNIVRSAIRLVLAALAVDRRDWLEVHRFSRERTRSMLAFGLPVSAAALCGFASRRWDNLFVSHFFGPGPTGMYNLAYNLADVPAIHVGEQIGDVLLPSFTRIPEEDRSAALLRAMTLLAMTVFPLAVGLGAVAPSLVAALFDARWQPIGPMLILLSALSVTRPISWVVASYLQARQLPRLLMWLELGKLALLVVAVVTIGRWSPLWTCVAVGLAFGAHMVASLWVIQRVEGVPLRRSIGSLVPALSACVPMVGAVLAVRALLGALDASSPVLGVTLESLVGAAVYVVAALVLARDPARDFIARITEAVRAHAPSS